MILMNEAELIQEQSGGILLTPEGFRLLQHELEQLKTVKRPEIADRIRESQQHGEFSEDNSELDEVKFEQAMVENRIAELQALFAHAHVLDIDAIPTDHVSVGLVVSVLDPQFDDNFDVRVVSSIEANPSRDLISNESPMGLALLGKAVNDDVVFEAPEGKKKFKVTGIRR